MKNIRLSYLFLTLVTFGSLSFASQIIHTTGPLDPTTSAAACRDFYTPMGVSGTYCYYIGFNADTDLAKELVENGIYNDVNEVTIAGQLQSNKGDGNISLESSSGSAIPNFGSVVPVSIPDAQQARYTVYTDTITRLRDAHLNDIKMDPTSCKVSVDISKLPSKPGSWCASVLNVYFSADATSARCVQSSTVCLPPTS